ncbi:hypothetical protein C1H46_025103 [Malus baccata]|uniref:Uncharacterized protein n=1 Tax=Malus baccata TaxID=106549 RepID=A0A540LS85_MALBA|nr:hypothetical protein C1H46_025103 [Malus baccata]
MVNCVFEDGPSMFPEDTAMDKDNKSSLMNDVMLCFSMLTNMEKYSNELDELHAVKKDSNKCKMRDNMRRDDKRLEMDEEDIVVLLQEQGVLGMEEVSHLIHFLHAGEYVVHFFFQADELGLLFSSSLWEGHLWFARNDPISHSFVGHLSQLSMVTQSCSNQLGRNT